MTTTLIEFLHQIDAWTPPEGFRRTLTLEPDAPSQRLTLTVADGLVSASERWFWRNEAELAHHLGELADRLDSLGRRAKHRAEDRADCLARARWVVASVGALAREPLNRPAEPWTMFDPPVVADAAGDLDGVLARDEAA